MLILYFSLKESPRQIYEKKQHNLLMKMYMLLAVKVQDDATMFVELPAAFKHPVPMKRQQKNNYRQMNNVEQQIIAAVAACDTNRLSSLLQQFNTLLSKYKVISKQTIIN